MKGTTILKLSLIVLIFVFVIHQAFSAFYKPITTETAVYDTVTDGINISGIIIRNEIVVKSDTVGVKHYVINDGNRVAKNGVIANIYDSENASITLSQVDSLRKKISDLQDMLSYNNVEATDLDLINSKIKLGLDTIITSGAYGDYEEISTLSDDLLTIINRKQVALGVQSDFSAQLETLNTQLASLVNSLPTAKGQIIAEQSGYFVSKVDGYEQVLSCENIELITPEYLSKLKSNEVAGNAIGKIVSDYEWYIAAEVSINESMNFKEGDTLTINTSIKSMSAIPATVKKINISENSSNAVLIFACNDMNSELATMRSGPMAVVKDEYRGLKVSKTALRLVDSKRGVYVVSGMQVKFVPVDIVYSGESYIICEQEQTENNVLRLYDEVVVKGKNLYDGKIIS